MVKNNKCDFNELYCLAHDVRNTTPSQRKHESYACVFLQSNFTDNLRINKWINIYTSINTCSSVSYYQYCTAGGSVEWSGVVEKRCALNYSFILDKRPQRPIISWCHTTNTCTTMTSYHWVVLSSRCTTSSICHWYW